MLKTNAAQLASTRFFVIIFLSFGNSSVASSSHIVELRGTKPRGTGSRFGRSFFTCQDRLLRRPLSCGQVLADPVSARLLCKINFEGDDDVATGTVKWFNPDKGYGFIQPDSGGKPA
jgi:hypothetical protein